MFLPGVVLRDKDASDAIPCVAWGTPAQLWLQGAVSCFLQHRPPPGRNANVVTIASLPSTSVNIFTEITQGSKIKSPFNQ